METDNRSATTPLMAHTPTRKERNNKASKTDIKLYDTESTLEIRAEVARGYLLLLRGITRTDGGTKDRDGSSQSGESSSQNESTAPSSVDESNLHLALAAIADGNIVDATLGVHTNGGLRRSRETSEQSFETSMKTKELLRMRSESDVFRDLVVKTYIECFEIVCDYHRRIDDLGLLSWCCKHQAVRRDSEIRLREAFAPLIEMLSASPAENA